MVENRWEAEFIAPLADPQSEDESGILTEAGMMTKLLEEIEAAGTQKAWSEAHPGVSRQFLCDILKGNRNISRHVAEAMGYRLIRMYEPIVKEGDANG